MCELLGMEALPDYILQLEVAQPPEYYRILLQFLCRLSDIWLTSLLLLGIVVCHRLVGI